VPVWKSRHDIRPVDLPRLASSDPALARLNSQRVLDGDPAPLAATYALHALAVVERDSGNSGRATRLFRRGARIAEKSELGEQWTELMAGLGTALATAGRHREALDVMNAVMTRADVHALPRVLVRRSAVYGLGGKHEKCYLDAIQAADLFGRG